MSVGAIFKRTMFEITFMFALIIMLPFHFLHAMCLLIWEIIKHYPPAIYEGVAGFYYGEDKEDS